MKPSQVASQVSGVWGMAFNRPGWDRALDRSLDGVFGSFSALLWAAPLMALNFAALKALFASSPQLAEDTLIGAPMPFWVAANLATAALDWAVGLCALLAAAHFLGAGKRAGDAVIGYNWMQLITAAVQSLPIFAGLAAKSASTFSVLSLPAIGVSLAILWGVLRRGLGLAPGSAVAVSAASILLSVLVGELSHRASLAIYSATPSP